MEGNYDGVDRRENSDYRVLEGKTKGNYSRMDMVFQVEKGEKLCKWILVMAEQC